MADSDYVPSAEAEDTLGVIQQEVRRLVEVRLRQSEAPTAVPVPDLLGASVLKAARCQLVPPTVRARRTLRRNRTSTCVKSALITVWAASRRI